MRNILLFSVVFLLIELPLHVFSAGLSPNVNQEILKPKIVNVINFIRLLEPRDPKITEDVLFQTVVEQVKIMRKYRLKGTFLLQYDALIDSRYQKLLKGLPKDSFDIGAWWELPQPLIEKAGYKWRGRYPWDWHADVGFSTGYSPVEREKIIDVYMADFKKIFGFYPQSVGSWFIDSHSLNYFYDKYRIVASCNCKDQFGTDGYTLWGGYWNQAYYPSRINSYMPAQNEKNQLPVPVFRMLGSDPVRQYDQDLGGKRQGVASLEPVYKGGGGNEAWVSWFFHEFTEGECMEFAYTQAGQENSFTWSQMSKGFEIQMPLIAKLKAEGKVQVETLAESGKWFRNRYKVTPATSVTVNNDVEGSSLKTVWFNSRFYRANLLWEKSTLRFRDIHLFNENLPSFYTNGKATSNECAFYTLPFVEGNFWSGPEKMAGLSFKYQKEGKEYLLEGETPTITSPAPGKLQISWPLKSFSGKLVLEMNEKQMTIKVEGKLLQKWFLDLDVAENTRLPFQSIGQSAIGCQFEGMNYSVSAEKGHFSKPKGGAVFRIDPDGNAIVIKMFN